MSFKLIDDEETLGYFGLRVWEDEKGNRINEYYNEKTGFWEVEK
jgi:hypothetical protein